MTSHTYEFNVRTLTQLLCPSLLPVAVFALLIHAGAFLHVLPRPRPTLDVDRTILVHQADASRGRSPSEVVLLGDSSCLIDVSASLLEEQLRRPVLNLGTLSFLDLTDYAELLKHCNAAHPEQAKTVVLLMHPESLRRAPGGTYHREFLRFYLAGRDFFQPVTLRDRVAGALGLEKFRSRILARVLPTPLPGRFGERFGFAADFEAFLTRNRGSAMELTSVAFHGNPEYRLAPQLESASGVFRAALPKNARLFVGITPVPAGYVPAEYDALYRQMLGQWSAWLGAATPLLQLPATLPDNLFATTTHLNEEGSRTYTQLLARSLPEP